MAIVSTERRPSRRLAIQLLTISVVFLLTLVGCANPAANSPAASPTPWHERPIDTSSSDGVVERLSGDDEAVRADAVAEVEANPERFNPGVFYGMSAIHFAEDRPQDAMFWFYAGQLRGRFDVNRCADELAGVYLNKLNEQFGPAINRYAFQHLDELEATVARVIEFDRSTPHFYDPRWINLHTPAAMTAAMKGESLDPTTMSKPEAEWPAIAERTRAEYEAGFADALAQAQR